MSRRLASPSRRTLAAAAVAFAALGGMAACSSHVTPDPPPASDGVDLTVVANVPSGNEVADRAALDALKAQVRAAARKDGCETGAQCASVGLGAKPCGGPWEYVVYCPRATDVPALTRAVAEVERVERAYNERYGMASTCDFVAPPGLEVVGGACRATGQPGGPTNRTTLP